MSNGLSKNALCAWGMAGSGFLAQIICIFTLNSVGMTIAYFSPDFGVSVTDAAIVSSVYGITYGGFGMIWGACSDRIGTRKTLVICGCGSAVFMMSFGLFANSLPVAVFLYACAGAFTAGLGTSLMPKLVSSWFASRWVGKALVVVSVGGTIAGVVIGVLAPQLILGFGWRGCFVGISLIGLCVTAAIGLLAKDAPKKYGQHPFGLADGEDIELSRMDEHAELQRESMGAKVIRVLKMPVTWKMGIIMILIQACIYTNTTFMVTTMTAAGYTLVAAGLISSTHRTAQTAGSIVWSPLTDIFARKYILALLGFLCAVTFVALFALLEDVETAVFGAATGFVLIAFLGFNKAFIPVYESQITELYPPEILGTGSGLIVTISLVGRFFGPFIAGGIIDATGSYNSIWLFNAACVLLMAVLVLVWIPKTGGKKYGNPFVAIKKALN